MTRLRSFLAVCLLLIAAAIPFLPMRVAGDEPAKPELPPSEPPQEDKSLFPDFGFMPSGEQYSGRFFRLRQDYPTEEPGADRRPTFLDIPFNENGPDKDNWKKYLLAVRDYCFEGQVDQTLPAGAGEIDRNWVLEHNKKRKWYHAPWQHWDHTGRAGREAIRGLTREATSQPRQLAPTQTAKFQTYAVGFYNEFGGYAIGRVWRDHRKPDPTAGRFPVGTVVCKVLFTQATPDQVPYLSSPLEWEAYAETSDADRTRKVQRVRLVQMDVMVRDPRAERINGTGWVFGTFCYNGALGNPNRWYNLVPVGLQWGADENLPEEGEVNPQPTRTVVNKRLKETVINESAELPPQHLGWGGRLNGPADYFASSCISCHSTAQYPVVSAMNPEFTKTPPPRGSGEWMRWFRNIKCGQPFSEHSTSLDFSLQLAGGVKNFHDWSAGQGGFSGRKEEALRDAKMKRDQFDVKRGKE